MKKFIALLVLFTTCVTANNNLFDNMDEETLKNTGIHKLTDAEKMELIKWIETSQQQVKQEIEQQVREEVTEQIKSEVTEQIKSEVAEEAVKNERRKFMGFTMRESDREEIKSSIVGEVNGWNGKTIITLENGQVWQQIDKLVTRFTKKTNPAITIEPKVFNSWMLYIDGLNRGIKVKRIK